MFKTLANAFRVKDIRTKLFYTFLMLIVVRIGSLLPIPGIDRDQLALMFSGDAFQMVDSFTGGSLTQMTVFALSITPYITSSIIMQLLTIAIPKLEEMQKDGEDGRKKIQTITRYVTVGLALVQSIAMVIGFGKSGIIEGYSAMSGFERVRISVTMVAILVAGSAFLMWIGERITEKGVGNGISIILVINIVSRIPSDMTSLFNQFVIGKKFAVGTMY